MLFFIPLYFSSILRVPLFASKNHLTLSRCMFAMIRSQYHERNRPTEFCFHWSPIWNSPSNASGLSIPNNIHPPGASLTTHRYTFGSRGHLRSRSAHTHRPYYRSSEPRATQDCATACHYVLTIGKAYLRLEHVVPLPCRSPV